MFLLSASLKTASSLFTSLFIFLSSLEILKNTRLTILATCALLFIPQIAWESKRDMTHTTLVLVFKVSYVKDRWLQPFLFAVPIFIFQDLTRHSSL